jgi:hypothetical protein
VLGCFVGQARLLIVSVNSRLLCHLPDRVRRGAELITQLRRPLSHLALHRATSLLNGITGSSRDHLCGLVHLICDH